MDQLGKSNLVLKNIDPEGVERNQSYANNYYDESHYWMCFLGAWNFLPDNKMSVDFKEVPVLQTYCCTGFVRQCEYNTNYNNYLVK